MTDNKTEIIAFIEKHKGQLCLDSCGELVRLVEFYEDAIDYYYKCQTLSRTLSDNGYVCHTAVGWMIPLKGKLTDKEYQYLEQFFNLNWFTVPTRNEITTL